MCRPTTIPSTPSMRNISPSCRRMAGSFQVRYLRSRGDCAIAVKLCSMVNLYSAPSSLRHGAVWFTHVQLSCLINNQMLHQF